MDSVTKIGYVVALKNDRGFGFISENPSKDERGIFFHFSNVVGGGPSDMKLGNKVTYIELPSKKGKQAVQVKTFD